MKNLKLSLLLFCMFFNCSTPILHAQYLHNNLPLYPKRWNARWITHPDIHETDYNHILFRKKFSLNEVPEQFIVHLSADNRYCLYVNGREVCFGPQLSDTRHWRYETLNLAPYLNEGKNIIAAEVMNWGEDRSYGIISFRTAFLLQGHSKREEMVNTARRGGWKVFQNPGMNEKPVNWITGDQIIGGFYASNPTDSVVA